MRRVFGMWPVFVLRMFFIRGDVYRWPSACAFNLYFVHARVSSRPYDDVHLGGLKWS